MKKLNVMLVGLLTLVLSLVCFSGCFLHQGKYNAVSYKFGPIAIDAPEGSYIELKGDEVANVYIKLGSIAIEQDDATWTAGEESNEYVLTTDIGEMTFVIDGSTMTLETAVGTITLEKE